MDLASYEDDGTVKTSDAPKETPVNTKLNIKEEDKECELESNGINKEEGPLSIEKSSDFEEFLKVALESDLNANQKEILKSKLGTLRHLYKKVNHYVEGDEFKKLLESQVELIKKDSENTVGAFLAIYQALKFEYEHQDVFIPLDTKRKIKKLDVTLKKLRKKIRILENAEVDLDDDDSSYIQLQR